MPLADRPRTALVLSGGGARGAYQVGVIRGLVEHGFLSAGPDVVLVNGAIVSRTSSGLGTQEASTESPGTAVRIPDGYACILGDNVRSSIDSRSLGLLPRTEVLGKVAGVIRKPW